MDLNAQNRAMDALRRLVGIFIWYPASEDSPEYPVEPLTQLDLGDTAIADGALAYLQHFPALEWLCLEDTHVSDDGLVHLECLRRLRELDLTHTRVTEKGVRALQRVLPHCSINY